MPPNIFARYPLPWTADKQRPSILRAANGSIIARFVAHEDVTNYLDIPGAVAASQDHCRMVSDLVQHADKLAADDGINDLRLIQQKVVEWANSEFPNRKPHWAFLKLFEEIGEVIKKPRDATEWADVFIMLVDLAHMHGVYDLGKSIKDKMELNQQRTWTQTEIGTMEHNNSEGKE